MAIILRAKKHETNSMVKYFKAILSIPILPDNQYKKDK